MTFWLNKEGEVLQRKLIFYITEVGIYSLSQTSSNFSYQYYSFVRKLCLKVVNKAKFKKKYATKCKMFTVVISLSFPY